MHLKISRRRQLYFDSFEAQNLSTWAMRLADARYLASFGRCWALVGLAWARSESLTHSGQNDEVRVRTALQVHQRLIWLKGQNSFMALWRRVLIASGPSFECFAESVSFLKVELAPTSETSVLIGLRRRLWLASNSRMARL